MMTTLFKSGQPAAREVFSKVDFTNTYTHLLMDEQGEKNIFTFDRKHSERLGAMRIKPK